MIRLAQTKLNKKDQMPNKLQRLKNKEFAELVSELFMYHFTQHLDMSAVKIRDLNDPLEESAWTIMEIEKEMRRRYRLGEPTLQKRFKVVFPKGTTPHVLAGKRRKLRV